MDKPYEVLATYKPIGSRMTPPPVLSRRDEFAKAALGALIQAEITEFGHSATDPTTLVKTMAKFADTALAELEEE